MKSNLAAAAFIFAMGPAVCSADPPFGKKPAYVEPLSHNQVACQVTDVACLKVALFVFESVVPWIADPNLTRAVAEQDRQTAPLTNVEINKLDIGWIERTDKALIESRMNNTTSKYLAERKAAGDGVITEIFVFDQYGLNVVQTDPTQDYNQGDEAKYWRTFMAGAGAVYIDIPRPDDGKNVSQASLTITDPGTGKAIGAMTVGVDMDRLDAKRPGPSSVLPVLAK